MNPPQRVIGAFALGLLAMSSAPAAGEVVAFDGFTATAPFATTQQNQIWNGIDGTAFPNLVTGPDVIQATNGFTAQQNDPANIPVGGDPTAGTAFIDFAGGVGGEGQARGTVYAFDVAPGEYRLEYAASWNTPGQAVLDAYLYDATLEPTTDHRFDWNTGNFPILYGSLTGITPDNVASLDGVDLLFDNGVLVGSQNLSAVSEPFQVGGDDLVVFRLAGVGFGDNSSGARLSLLKLIPTSGALPGDYNGDAVVDAADYTVWRDTRGSTTELAADGNGDGTVNDDDYVVWADQLGATAPAAVSVPEPATQCGVLLLALGAALRSARGRSSRDGSVRSESAGAG